MFTCTTEKLFNELKNGDVFGFWRKGLFSDVIRYFQKKQCGITDDEICHVGVVYEVIRTILIDNSEEYLELLTFKLGEQTAIHGGLFDDWQIEKHIIRNKNQFSPIQYIIHKNTKEQILYWRNFDMILTEQQKIDGIYDQSQIIGKIYGFSRLVTSLPFVSKLLSKYFSNVHYIPWFMKSRVCSDNVWDNFYAIKRISYTEYMANPQPTPEFVCTYNENACKGKLYEITDFQINLIK